MKTKSILVIVLTLVIGFILGMLVSAEMRYSRLKPMRVFFSEERFREGFYKAIQPDARQKEKIDVILDKYAKLNSSLQSDFRKNLDENMKNFRKEIDSNLSKEQIERLKEMDQRRQEFIRSGKRFHDGDTLRQGGWRGRHRRGAGHPFNADSTISNQ